MYCTVNCEYLPYTNIFIQTQKWKNYYLCSKHACAHWCVSDSKFCVLDHERGTCLLTNRNFADPIISEEPKLSASHDDTYAIKRDCLFDNFLSFKQSLFQIMEKYEHGFTDSSEDFIESDLQLVYTTLRNKGMLADYNPITILNSIAISLLTKYHNSDRYFTDRTIKSIGKMSWRDKQIRRFIDNIINS